jgi:outer membrane protein
LLRNPRIFWLALWCASAICTAQPPKSLTLEQAREIALLNHPRIQSAGLIAEAANTAVIQARAPYYPTLAGNFTGAGAQSGTTLSAGALTTSSLYSRVASGIAVGQMVTDFGRTAALAATAKLRATAQARNVVNTRAQILLEVSQAYFQALSADSVLKAAQAAVDNRSLTLRQVRALAASLLKSTLDVSFTEVALSEAELQLYRAENDVQAGRARLAAALGFETSAPFELTDTALPAPLVPEPDSLIAQALKDRPDLAVLTLNRDAAARFADAEKRLRYPSITALGTAGVLPAHDDRLHGTYSAAGVNLNIPVLNGGLFAARRTEAELRAKAASSDIQDLAVLIARDVRFAWLEANTAFRRLAVTARLVAETAQALRLAQLRYDNGLGSIVELNQAQFSQTSAEIEAASAKYEYLSRRSSLDYAIGALR